MKLDGYGIVTVGINEMSKPKVILVCGPPCSGKSTWIKNNNVENLQVLSTDIWIEENAKSIQKTYTEVFDHFIQPAVCDLEARLKLFSNSRDSFIVDQTNLNKWSRKNKLIYCEDYYKVAVYFEVSLEVLLERNKQREGKIVPEEVIRTMYNRYKRPTEEEEFDEIIDGVNFSSGTSDLTNELLCGIILDI